MGIMICMGGLPGSGKTKMVKEFCNQHRDFLYFNPDEYYARINGDECIRDNAFEVWHSLFRDVYTAQRNGRNVVIDTDNLTYAQRNQWVEWFPYFSKHILCFIEEEIDVCIERVNQRRRTIPAEVMEQKALKMEYPWPFGETYTKDRQEWDEIYRICNISDGSTMIIKYLKEK